MTSSSSQVALASFLPPLIELSSSDSFTVSALAGALPAALDGVVGGVLANDAVPAAPASATPPVSASANQDRVFMDRLPLWFVGAKSAAPDIS